MPPDAQKRKGARAGWTGGAYAWMRTVLTHEPGRGLYRRRPGTIEPVFADEKHTRSIDRFQRRGRPAVLSEWRLINATHNLLKLHRHRLEPPPAKTGTQQPNPALTVSIETRATRSRRT